MYAAIFLLTAVHECDTFDPAARFGVSVEQAAYMLKLASEHGPTMKATVRGSNDEWRFWRWQAEVEWRKECWRLLHRALDRKQLRQSAWCSYPEYDRQPFQSEFCRAQATTLRELRAALGDADFVAGRMPKPTPSYRPWSD